MTLPKRRSPWVVLLLVLLPLWLVASGGGALWYYFQREKKLAAVEQQRFAQTVSIPMLEDDLKKIVEVIGERNASSETASAGLSRAASMIEGTLGPSNTGYAVKKIPGPAKWPIFQVTIRGKNETAPAIWILASYDSPKGSRGAEANATGLAATIAAAQAMALEKPPAPIHFAFIPHANDQDSPVADTVTRLVAAIKEAGETKAVLYVEAMANREELWVSPDQPPLPPVRRISGLGAAWGGNPTDFGVTLAKAGLPAVTISTRTAATPGQDEKLPFAPTVAASAGRLIELIRRITPQ